MSYEVCFVLDQHA